MSRNLEFRDILTVHEKAIYDLDTTVSESVTVKKDFLCKSYSPNITGIMLRKFGFWRYSNNHLKANDGLALKCAEYNKKLELKEISKDERREATLAGGSRQG